MSFLQRLIKRIKLWYALQKSKNSGVMTEEPKAETEETTFGNLNDFVVNTDHSIPLDIEIAIEEDGRVILFHNKPFRYKLSWFEFDTETNKLDFVIEDGNVRDFGMPLKPVVAKYMHNAHQILTVEVNQETGQASHGSYIPLIMHGN